MDEMTPYNSNSFLDDDKDPHIISLSKKHPYLEDYEELGLSKPMLQGVLDGFGVRRPSRLEALLLPTTRKIDVENRNPQVLVVCPTLELTKEITDMFLRIQLYDEDGDLDIGLASLTPRLIPRRFQDLSSHVIIGVPDTLCTLLSIEELIVSDINMVVLDGLDHILELSAGSEIHILMKAIRSDCQVLTFYSTLTDSLREYLPTILPECKWNRVFVNQEELAIFFSKTFQLVLPDERAKSTAVRHILERVTNRMQVVIYVNKHSGADMLIRALFGIGGRAGGLVATPEVNYIPEICNIPDYAISLFKFGGTRVLITRDPIYFGFDLSKVNIVIFFHMPMNTDGEPDFEKYYRLATWGGRRSNKACIINMLYQNEELVATKLEKYFGRKARVFATW